jgi:hypothetical protein
MGGKSVITKIAKIAKLRRQQGSYLRHHLQLGAGGSIEKQSNKIKLPKQNQTRHLGSS